MTINDYTILSASEFLHLEERVSDMLKLGWKPIGGVSVTAVPTGYSGGGRYTYLQAMIREAQNASL